MRFGTVPCDRILLLDIYAKNEKEDLAPVEVRRLRMLVREYLL